MSIEWKPIDKCPRQTMVLVGHEEFRGFFEVAECSALGEWTQGLMTNRPLRHQPTHYAELDPPPCTNYVAGTVAHH